MGVAGLFNEETQTRLPLQGVHVEARVIDYTAEVSIVHQYRNDSDASVNATYIFPLDERAAVCAFEARVGDRVIRGECQEKKRARKAYEKAVERKDGAYLLEQNKPDIFQTRIGNILPGMEVTICICYVTELKGEGTNYRFVLPTKVYPRYHSASSPDDMVDDQGGGSAQFEPPHGLSLVVDARAAAGWEVVNSPSHTLDVRRPVAASNTHVVVTLRGGAVALATDVVIVFTPCVVIQPHVVLERKLDPATLKTSFAAMLSWQPAFDALPHPSTEIIFLIDRSGSMQGSRISQARNALQLFLRSLPIECTFNLVSFGDRFTSLFKQPTAYEQESLEQATALVDGMDADMGGTELQKPLDDIFAHPPPSHRHRKVFVLTDGDIGDTQRVLNAVSAACKSAPLGEENASGTTCVFALGIGSGVSQHLVEGLARAGRGTAEFVADNEVLDVKVIRQLKQAIAPSIGRLAVEWGQHASLAAAPTGDPTAMRRPVPPALEEARPEWVRMCHIFDELLTFKRSNAPQSEAMDTTSTTTNEPAAAAASTSASTASAAARNAKCVQAPYDLPPVFSGSRATVYALYASGVLPPQQVTVNAMTTAGPQTFTVAVDLAGAHEGNLIHCLAARSLIRDLEEGTSYLHTEHPSNATVDNEILSVALTYSLTSRCTSFLAIEDRDGELLALSTDAASMGLGEEAHLESAKKRKGFAAASMMVSSAPPPAYAFAQGSMMTGMAPPVRSAMPMAMSMAVPSMSAAAPYAEMYTYTRRMPGVATPEPGVMMDMEADVQDASSGEDESAHGGFLDSTEECAQVQVQLQRERARHAKRSRSRSRSRSPKRARGRPSKEEASPRRGGGGSGANDLQAIIRSQRFDGSFPVTQTLLDAIGSSQTVEELEAAAAAQGRTAAALITELVVAFLQAQSGTQYELVVTKASAWLARQ